MSLPDRTGLSGLSWCIQRCHLCAVSMKLSRPRDDIGNNFSRQRLHAPAIHRELKMYSTIACELTQSLQIAFTQFSHSLQLAKSQRWFISGRLFGFEFYFYTQYYRVTVNNFLADGGDKFYVLAQGINHLGGAQDIDSFEAWLNNPAADSGPVKSGVQVAPGPQNRIALTP